MADDDLWGDLAKKQQAQAQPPAIGSNKELWDTIGDWHDVGRAAHAGWETIKDQAGKIAGDFFPEIGKSLDTNLSGAASGLGYVPKATATPNLQGALGKFISGETPSPEQSQQARHELAGAIKEGLRAPYETGRGLLSAAATIPDALYSGLNSVIGHPMTDAERYVGKAAGASLQHYFPDTAAGELGKRMQATAAAEEANPEAQRQHYEQTAAQVPTAMAAGRPAGFTPGLKSLPGGRIPGEPRPIPARSTEQIFDTAEHLFNQAHNAGVSVTPKSYFDTLDNIPKLLRDAEFYNPKGRGEAAYNFVNQIRESGHQFNQYGMVGLPEIFGDIKDVRALIRQTKMDSPERAALSVVENALVGFMKDLHNNPAAVKLSPGPAGIPMPGTVASSQGIQRATDDLQRAIEIWGIGRKADAIEEVVKNALGGAKATGSRANVESKIRQGMNSILKSPARRWGYDADEIKMMEKIRDGHDNAEQMLLLLSKMAPSGIISATGGLEIARILGAHGINKFVPGALGIAAKTALESKRYKDVEALKNLIKGKATEGFTTSLPDYMAWKKRRIFDPRVMAPFLSQFQRDDEKKPFLRDAQGNAYD